MVKGFEIVGREVLDELNDYRETYNDKGKYLGFKAIDEFYTMQLGNVTDWTGYPMSGKTQILMEVLLNTSKFYGWKHLVYLPDVGNKTEIVADLIHKLTGKSFNPKFENHISKEEISREIDWILEHFKILTKKEVKSKMTPFEFYDLAATMDIQTASIDSWKDMSHPYKEYGGYATYLEVVLPYRNQIAEDNNIHINTVIHPKLTEKENGKRNAPTPYDLKGGSEWFNSGKCMITVHRESKDDNIAQINFNKIKPRSIGKIGGCELRFDLNKFVYYEEGINSRTYAHEKGQDILEDNKPPRPIENNKGFDAEKISY